MSTIDLRVEFSGGLELLFGNQRVHAVSLPAIVPDAPDSDPAPTGTSTSASAVVAGTKSTVSYLIRHLRTHFLKERPELFVDGDTVYVPCPCPLSCSDPRLTPHSRPGILVLINDTDWELEGEGAYELQNGDEIVFISTLHGG